MSLSMRNSRNLTSRNQIDSWREWARRNTKTSSNLATNLVQGSWNKIQQIPTTSVGYSSCNYCRRVRR